jgi:hypothetical protein
MYSSGWQCPHTMVESSHDKYHSILSQFLIGAAQSTEHIETTSSSQ